MKTPLATVSRKISELSPHLRTQLFNRSSRKLVLTDAGSSYLVACKGILAAVTEAERAAAGEYAAPTGELVVTAPVVFGRVCLIPILVDFLTAYPDIDVSLVLNDRVLSLFQEEIDVGLRIGALPDSSIVAIRVGAFHRVVCASPRISRLAERLARPRIWPGTTASALQALCQCHRMFGHSSETRRTLPFRCMRGSLSAVLRRPVTRRAPASELPPWVLTLSGQLWSAER